MAQSTSGFCPVPGRDSRSIIGVGFKKMISPVVLLVNHFWSLR
jgi:hypothetical protein